MPHLDWIQYTVKEFYTDSDCFLCKESAFNSLPSFLQDDILSYCDDSAQLQITSVKGVNFYGNGFQFMNGIKVFYNPVSYEMGYNVIISGDVLSSVSYTDDDIRSWVSENEEYITFSRIDIAYDCSVDFSEFYRKFEAGEYITRLRDCRQCVNSDHRGTLYFGKRGGRVMFRIYDKKQEQIDSAKGRKNKDFLRKNLSVWTRIEGQFRHDAATQALNNYLSCTIGNVFLGHLRFVESLDGLKNKSRDSVVWSTYLDVVGGKFFMVCCKKKNDYFNREFFEKNVLPQVKAVQKHCPELFDLMYESADVSKSTLKKLCNDELLLKREQKRLLDKDQVFVEQLCLGDL